VRTHGTPLNTRHSTSITPHSLAPPIFSSAFLILHHLPTFVLPDVEAENIVEDVIRAGAGGQQLKHLAKLLRYLLGVHEQVATHHDDDAAARGWLAIDGHHMMLHLSERALQ